jgi:phosphopantothenoylcysteine decarboxylase/phosphopantothenate--cysteine ligase
MHLPQNVIIGISGGIAAYKTLSLIRLFKKNGIGVKVVVTQNALQFITKLSVETLSENSVYSDVFENLEEYSTGHISITDKADCLIVAPATANIIGKFASGIADDALSTSYLSFNKDVFIAPAMNTKMWNHPANQANIKTLTQRGVQFIQPVDGFLACGYEGQGRMEEPEEIFKKVISFYSKDEPFSRKKIIVTAGPTYEAIDAVRFIGNHSSGKMGYAIAQDFAEKGAQVTLISGPVDISIAHPNITVINVNNASEMYEQCMKHFPQNEIMVMAAAVADYTPEVQIAGKLKKNEDTLNIRLKPTVDILKEMGKQKQASQILVGFALESNNEIENAKEKLLRKNADCIILNSLNDQGSGFHVDTNKVTIIDKNKITEIPLKTKSEIAKDIVSYIFNTFIKNSST